MPRIDRVWVGSTVVTGVGPLVVPSRPAVVASLLALARTGPDARVGLRFDPGSPRHWRYRTADLAEYIDSCVVALPARSDDDVDALLARLSTEHRGPRPVTVFLGDRHVFAMVSHAVGDSRLALSLPSVLVAHARTGQFPAWVGRMADPHPLRTAVRHTFPSRAAVSSLLSTRRATRAARAQIAMPEAGAADAVPFRPDPTSVGERGEPGRTRLVQGWTREHARGAAHFAAVVTMAAQALGEQGIDCLPVLHMVYDLRRYLPRGRTTMASFVGGVDLPVPLADPVELTRVVTRAAKAGHPLAAATAAAVLPARRAHRRTMTKLVSSNPRAELALSYLGAKTPEPDLPWLDGPDDCHYSSLVDPAGPTAITLLVAVVGGRLQLSASFHGSVFDADAVRRALRSVHDEPIRLLEAALKSAPG